MVIKKINITLTLMALFASVVLMNTACQKDEVTTDIISVITTDSISIVSMEASRTSIKAWDTTTVTVHAIGENLVYQWSADEGTIVKAGADSVIHFTACQSCIGTRVITCKVSNKTGFVTDTIHMNVTSYFK